MALSNKTVHGLVNNTPRARVVRHLKEWMEDGRLIAGTRLPPEMQLAGKLNVSRTTIRLALAALNSEGLIASENRQWVVKQTVSPSKGLLTDCIALIIDPPDISVDPLNDLHTVGHEHFTHLGAISAIRRAGYDAFIIHPERLKGDLIQRMIAQRPKGAIILSGVAQDSSGRHIGRALHEGNIPFVVYGDLNRASEMEELATVDTVISDHEAGAYALTKWLISQGRKRILRFWEIPWASGKNKADWLARRNRGYERAMREAGLEPLPALETYEPLYPIVGLSEQEFQFHTRVMAGYLVEYLQGAQPVDAIMAIWDGLVGQVSAALRVHGKEPNQDVLIVGYDNVWEDLHEVQRWEPLGPAATIDKRNTMIGYHLMSLLQERIDGKLFDKAEQRVVKPHLVIRPAAFPKSQSFAPIVIPVA